MRAFTWRVHRAAWLVAIAACLVALAACSSGKKESGGGGFPPSYGISGTVAGDVAAGVTIRIQGTTRKAVTNALGHYAITGLSDGTYVLEASFDGYSFTPATRTVAINGANVTGQDFASVKGLSLAGSVTGDVKQGVTLTLEGPDPLTSIRTATSDDAGAYTFSNVASGVYHVTPSLAGGWTFAPANILVTVGTASLTGANFTAIAATHTISGRVTGALAAGVTVVLTGDRNAVTVTDALGNYAFANLAPGSYTVAATYAGYAFSPATRSATITTANVAGQDFASAATHKLAGRVSGAVLGSVGVALTGMSSGATTTDPTGYFEFDDLVDGVYTVAPSLDGYAFSPVARVVALAGADVRTADFTASAAPTPVYTVSGSVSAVGAGATVTLEGDATYVATTDAAGVFSIADVTAGTYLLVPYHDDYTFDPASRLVVVTGSLSSQTFTATVRPTARTILGNIAGPVSAGVTVTLSDGASQTTTTDAAGTFAFRNLGDGTYRVTPSLSGFGFTPADCLVTIAGPSVTYVQFSSFMVPHSISGAITGAVLTGVGVELAGNGVNGMYTTGIDGRFTFGGLPDGAYTVAPTLAGYFFSPAIANVTVAGADVTGVAFVSAPTHRIAGTVTGDKIDDVIVALTGAATAVTTTDVAGRYEFVELRDGNYTVTPTSAEYTFTPQLLQILPVTLAAGDVTNADFVSRLIPTYSVSGTITGGTSVNVRVDLTGVDPVLTTSTDAGGVYTFSRLKSGSYMVIPSGATFNPASRAFRINYADVTGQDFTSPP
jgi:inhibitor of cysteine peptidase